MSNPIDDARGNEYWRGWVASHEDHRFRTFPSDTPTAVTDDEMDEWMIATLVARGQE